MVVAMVAVLAGGAPNAYANSHNCFGEAATIVGTSGDDALIGTDGPDLICGGRGDDGEFLPSRGGKGGALSGGLGSAGSAVAQATTRSTEGPTASPIRIQGPVTSAMARGEMTISVTTLALATVGNNLTQAMIESSVVVETTA